MILFQEGEIEFIIISSLDQENHDLIRKAQNLRHEIYLQYGYIDRPYPERIIREREDQQEGTVYIVAVEKNEVVGTFRINSQKPLRTSRFFSINESYKRILSLKETAEVGALVVSSEGMRKKVSWGLYKANHLYHIKFDNRYWVADIDQRALRALSILGWKHYKIGEPQFYMGSLTVPVVFPVLEQKNSVKKSNTRYYKYLKKIPANMVLI